MKAQHRTATLVAALTLLTVSACRSSDEETGMPAMLKIRFETEMKMTLNDVKRAEAMAYALGNRYLGLDELQAQYLSGLHGHAGAGAADVDGAGNEVDGAVAVDADRG